MNSQEPTYDVTVVGAGLIGSAAARHVAEITGNKILLIGPEETKDRQTTEIFGAHRDEGRITRLLDPNIIWGHMAAKSINRYRDIEERSGIKFFTEVGFMAVAPKSTPVLQKIKENAAIANTAFDTLTAGEVSKKMPFLKFPNDYECLCTESKSGYISPRRLVRAQKSLAVQAGCDVVDDIVQQLDKDRSSGYINIVTDKQQIFRTKRALICTGAFTICRDLLPSNRLPKLKIQTETVSKLRISESEARRLAEMPSIVEYNRGEASGKLGTYILPPILYPNGYYYLKIGHGRTVSEILTSPEKLTEWQRSYGDATIASRLKGELMSFLPGLDIDGVEMDSCLTSLTEHGYPYIDMVTERVGVAIGGCGGAAKSSDEIGRLAARMIATGSWPEDEVNSEYFRYRSTENRNLKSRV